MGPIDGGPNGMPPGMPPGGMPTGMGGPPLPQLQPGQQPPGAPDEQQEQQNEAQPITQQPHAPLAEMRIGDGPEFADLPLATKRTLPGSMNFADREKYRDQYDFCRNELWGIVKRIKDRRKPQEDEWLAIQRLRTLTHDGGQKYKGRSNVYVPVYASAHNTLVAQTVRGLFPSDEYMDVSPKNANNDQEAAEVKDKIEYQFDCNAKLQTQIKPAVSQLWDHGNGVIKYWWKTGAEFVGGKKNKQFGFHKRKQEGLCVSARSIFNVVVYPENASDDKEVLITAEYVTMARNYAIQMGKTERWCNTDEALATASNVSAQDQYARDTTLQDVAKTSGLTTQVDYTSDVNKPIVQLITVVEAWCDVRLPPEGYTDDENNTLPVPARVVMIDGIPVSITRNPYYHQKHPYKWGRINVVPGSFYGSGAGRKARFLQYMVNDLANQTNDCGIYSLNPFIVYDPNSLIGPLLPVAPGRTYRVRGNPKDAMMFAHPPAELIQYGSQMVNMYINLLMDNVGAPPVMQGIQGKDATATGQSILQRNSLQPLQDVVEDLERQWMTPLMEDTWMLLVQYSDEPVIITKPAPMPGMPPVQAQLTLSDLDEFDYDFKFLASTQTSNQQLRAQQAIQMLQSAVPIAQLLQMNGKMLDPTIVLRALHRDLGLRDFDQLIKPMPMQMQGPQTPGGAPNEPQENGPSQPGGQAPTKAIRGSEQNAPIPQPLGHEPQATDDFMANRTITDEINAMIGGRGGK